MSRRKGFLIGALVLAGFIALAALLVSLAPEPERREPPSRVPFVQTAAVAAGVGAIPVYGAGVVRPVAEIDLAPQVGGRVVWVEPALRSGGRVTAGQVLFRLDAADYELGVLQAEAALEARRVELLKAEEAAAIAADEYERFAARAGSDALPATPLVLHQPQLEAARTALRREEGAVAHAKLALARTRVTAPFDGIVREESVETGQLMTAHVRVGRIFSTDAVEVVVPLADAEASLIPGLWQDGGTERAEAIVHAEYGEVRGSWRGFVDRALASLDETTRTIEVIVRVPNPFAVSDAEEHAHPPLLVGKFAEVTIDGTAPGGYSAFDVRPCNPVTRFGACVRTAPCASCRCGSCKGRAMRSTSPAHSTPVNQPSLAASALPPTGWRCGRQTTRVRQRLWRNERGS